MSGAPDRRTGSSQRVPARLVAAGIAGTLATMTMDGAMLGAALIGGERFNSDRLSVQMIGRWGGGLLKGRLRHDDITTEKPIPGELVIGLATHYATGVILTEAFLMLPRRSPPSLSAAVAYGLATSVLPFLVLFPSLGYGPFGLRSGEAGRMSRVMTVGHTAFGAGIGVWGRRLWPR